MESIKNSSNVRYVPAVYVVSTFVVILSAFEIFAVFYWGQGKVLEKLSALFALVGIYGLAIGLFSRRKALKTFKDVMDDLVSPNPATYLRANFIFASFVSSFATVALSPRRLQSRTLWFGCIGSLIWLPIAFLFLAYFIFHLLVIAPIAYFPTLIACMVVNGITSSAEDVKFSIGAMSISIREIVSENPTEAKGFVTGVPAAILAIAGNLLSLFS